MTDQKSPPPNVPDYVQDLREKKGCAGACGVFHLMGIIHNPTYVPPHHFLPIVRKEAKRFLDYVGEAPTNDYIDEERWCVEAVKTFEYSVRSAFFCAWLYERTSPHQQFEPHAFHPRGVLENIVSTIKHYPGPVPSSAIVVADDSGDYCDFQCWYVDRARYAPQDDPLFVTDGATIEKFFDNLRTACPSLPLSRVRVNDARIDPMDQLWTPERRKT